LGHAGRGVRVRVRFGSALMPRGRANARADRTHPRRAGASDPRRRNGLVDRDARRAAGNAGCPLAARVGEHRAAATSVWSALAGVGAKLNSLGGRLTRATRGGILARRCRPSVDTIARLSPSISRVLCAGSILRLAV
jgi:hypothetical protein